MFESNEFGREGRETNGGRDNGEKKKMKKKTSEARQRELEKI